MTYKVVLNVTGSPASGAQVVDVLPDHMVFVSAATPVPDGGTFTQSGSTLTWNWSGSLPVGAVTLTYQATVDNFVQEGTVLTNHAVVSYANGTPKSAQVSLTLATIYDVKIDVYNETGELVKHISTQELSQQITGFDLQNPTISTLGGTAYVDVGGAAIASWDGNNNSGNPVSNGKYYVTVTNSDAFGQTTTVSQVVMVSRHLATVEVDIYNEAGEIVKHLYTYANDPTDTPMTQVNLSTAFINPSQGSSNDSSTTANKVTITSPNGVNVVWDGTSDTGSIVTNGHYEIDVHWTDGKGVQEEISRGIVVQARNNPVTDGTVWAQPNILQGGATTTTLQVSSSASYTLQVGLYDVAGELIKRYTGSTGTNQATLDLAGLSSGLYFAVVELTGPNGGIVQRQTTQLVIQH